MDPLMNFDRMRRAALAACLAFLLVPAVSAQDTDDDGTLPHHDGAAAAEPGTVGVAAAAPGLDLLQADSARLSIEAIEAETSLDTSVMPADAMFIADGPYRYEVGYGVRLQADGQLMLADGYHIALQAAPQAVARVTLLVVHSESVGLPALLSGAAAPLFVVSVGDLAVADLGVVQGLVQHHADTLAGLAVSLVDVSLDLQGDMHLGAARFTTDGGPVQIAID